METIKTYLDNMFFNLPVNDKTARIKEQMLSNMEEKYNELKAEGRSEHEAIGIVIGEFGSIDELTEEFGLAEKEQPEGDARIITQEEAIEYLSVRKRTSWLTGIGIAFCISAAGALIAITGIPIIHAGTYGVGAMLVCVAIGVALFIISENMINRFEWIEDGETYAEDEVKNEVRRLFNKRRIKSAVLPALGVFSIFLGVVVMLCMTTVIKAAYCLGIMLALIGVGVMLLEAVENTDEGYNILLGIKKGKHGKKHTDDYTKNDNRPTAVKIITAIIWPFAVLSFLAVGFIFKLWHPVWLIFVFAWLVNTVTDAVGRAVMSNDEKK